MTEYIDRQAAIDGAVTIQLFGRDIPVVPVQHIEHLPAAQPERKPGKWILDRSGAYSCSECMEPCATYVMMKPRDRFCKMCGAEMADMRGEQDGGT